MKIILLIGGLGIASLFFTPGPKNIAGTWVLDAKESKAEAAVLRLHMGEGYYKGSLDIPAQQLYNKSVGIRFNHDSVIVMLDEQRNCFIKALVTDSTLEGRSIVNGKSQMVKFRRLKD